MPELGRYARELRARLWKPDVRDEVASEIQTHIDMLEEDLVRQGMSRPEAREQAQRRFGDPHRVAAACVDEGQRRDAAHRRVEWRSELAQDVRLAWRQLVQAPRFTLVALATLTTGLGAAILIFAIVSAVLLRPLPFRDPDGLVLINEKTPAGAEFAISESNYLDWVQQQAAFTDLAIFEATRMGMAGDNVPEQLRVTRATHTFLPTLGMAPMLGRAFGTEHDRKGGDNRVALLSHALWMRRFGGDPSIVGQGITLDGKVHRVMGVMPERFDFPEGTEAWVPLVPVPEWPRGDHRNEGVARLKPGVTLEQARGDLERVAADLSAAYVDNRDWSASVRPFKDWFVSPQLGARMLILMATVALLLAMACVNVANLLLARAASREREMAVRAALGAGRWRIVRQLLTESMLLSVIGASGGLLLAAILVPLMRRLGSEVVPQLRDLSIDGRVLAFAVPASLVAGVFFALAPIARLARASGGAARLHDLLRSGSRVAQRGRTRELLIVASVACATTLLVSAALVATSFRRLMQVDPGFQPAPVLVAQVNLPESSYSWERSAAYVAEATARLRAIPGVRAAGATNLVPFHGGNTAMEFAAAERANAASEGYRSASWRTVTPEYFAALAIPLKRGRVFTEADRAGADTTGETVVVVNEELARQAWPGLDPVGRRLALGNGSTMTVIGVVGDTRHLSLDSLPRPAMYFSHAQFPWKSMWFVVRGAGEPAALGSAVRAALAPIDPGLPVAELQPLMVFVDREATEPRLTMLVFGVFAVAALVLVSAGLYGLVSYMVSQQTREIGVAMALGAAPSRVVRTVLFAGLRLGGAGVASGLVLAAGTAGSLRAILYETAPLDLLTYGLVGVSLLAVTVLASVGPARRASSLDPVAALRRDI